MTIPAASTQALVEEGFTEDDLAGVTVTMEDVRIAGYCGGGLVGWMAAYGFDLRDFVRNGMSATSMISTGDAQGIRVVIGRLKVLRDG